MKFHLTYDGALYGSGNTTKRAGHKHAIRLVFHEQLKQLWRQTWLAEARQGVYEGYEHIPSEAPLHEGLAIRHTRFGQGFVPLVSTALALSCSLKILFLRSEPPGAVVASGDIDNRIKTLFDALRMPQNANEMPNALSGSPRPERIYCLMEDDKLISHVEIETGLLLHPAPAELTGHAAKANVRLFIEVDIWPNRVVWGNIGFAGR